MRGGGSKLVVTTPNSGGSYSCSQAGTIGDSKLHGEVDGQVVKNAVRPGSGQ